MKPDEPISETEAAALFAGLAAAPALVLAVSGGPDSTALMWLAARWRDRLKHPPKLIAVTVDHGLRKESAPEALAVRKLARALKVTHHTLRWTGAKPKTGIQEAARNARYRLLGAAARRQGARHILTAHTLDDQAETMLFRMARGSGVSGLAGMRRSDAVPVPDGRGMHLIRPLLGVSKARLIATLDAVKIAYAVDPSNADPRFARPRFRALTPALAREGLTAERLGRLAQRVARIEDALFATMNDVQADLSPGLWQPGKPVSVDAEAFIDLPEEIGLRLLQRMINLVGNEGPAELGQLEVLHAELSKIDPDIRLGRKVAPVRRTLAGALVTLSGAKLLVERAPPRREGGKGRISNARRAKGPFTTPR